MSLPGITRSCIQSAIASVCLFVYERSASSASALPLATVWICCPYHGVIPSTQSWTGGSQAWGGRQARAVLIIFIIIATLVAVVRRILITASKGRGFMPLVRRLTHFPYSRGEGPPYSLSVRTTTPYSIYVGHTSLTSVTYPAPICSCARCICTMLMYSLHRQDVVWPISVGHTSLTSVVH